ncbi:MAG: HAMP domain-containing histidine kinase [Clostridia bacterium]|nr:HAMP domain-containing histidine kinase [Clostridia bacterium]
MSIRLKIVLWFSGALIIVAALTLIIVLSMSYTVLQKTVRENLVELVENNKDEVEFFASIEDIANDNDKDHYIEYNGGYLEIDDDFLDSLNGIHTALYMPDGTFLYGENPIARYTGSVELFDAHIQKIKPMDETYYVYDRVLVQPGTEGLYLRGVVSEAQGKAQLSSIAYLSLILMPFLIVFAISGGYIIADRAMSPVKDISDAAESITYGDDLKKRIELKSGKDELHRLANTFNAMLDRLNDSFEAERRLTADVSHEMRTPLTVILAQCELLHDEGVSEDEMRDALSVVNRQSRRLSKLVNDMLEFVRLERRTVTYDMEKLNLSHLAESVCDDMRMIRERGITLICEVEDDVHVHGNYDLLTRMLSNLVSNAYRYGRDEGEIHVVLRKEEEKALLQVKDNGIGIKTEDLQHIFGRFYRVDKSRNTQGTGLGLPMVREIAHMHGGDVSVESEYEKGSTFTVTLPVKK